jgi:hypothetical protein
LNVTDDDGAWSAKVTNCRVTIPIFWLNVTIVDAISGKSIPDAEVKIDGRQYPLVDGSVFLEAESGEHRITATAIDYLQTKVDIPLTGSISEAIDMNPLCTIRATNEKGTQMVKYASDESVYATVSSPDIYQSQIFVIAGAPPADQAPISDATGGGPVNIEVGKGQTSLVWPPDQRRGEFRLVLDLDSDGVFDSSYDRLSPRFSIPEMIFLMAILMNFLAVIFKLARGLENPVPR